jgi:hypothetical protein
MGRQSAYESAIVWNTPAITRKARFTALRVMQHFAAAAD